MSYVLIALRQTCSRSCGGNRSQRYVEIHPKAWRGWSPFPSWHPLPYLLSMLLMVLSFAKYDILGKRREQKSFSRIALAYFLVFGVPLSADIGSFHMTQMVDCCICYSRSPGAGEHPLRIDTFDIVQDVNQSLRSRLMVLMASCCRRYSLTKHQNYL